MAFSFFDKLTLGAFAVQAYQNKVSFDLANQQAFLTNQKRLFDAQQRNQTLAENEQIISQQKALELKSLGFDMQDIAFLARREKASALAKFAGQAGINSQSFRLHTDNIARQGYNARSRRNFNYGTRIKNLDIELKGQRRATIAANRAASFILTPDATGLALSQLGLGISAIKEVGYTVNPTTGKVTPKST